MVSLACLKICFRPIATLLFFFISRSPLHCALSASILGSVSHPVGDRPSHPICEVRFSECGLRAGLRNFPLCEKPVYQDSPSGGLLPIAPSLGRKRDVPQFSNFGGAKGALV